MRTLLAGCLLACTMSSSAWGQDAYDNCPPSLPFGPIGHRSYSLGTKKSFIPYTNMKAWMDTTYRKNPGGNSTGYTLEIEYAEGPLAGLDVYPPEQMTTQQTEQALSNLCRDFEAAEAAAQAEDANGDCGDNGEGPAAVRRMA